MNFSKKVSKLASAFLSFSLLFSTAAFAGKDDLTLAIDAETDKTVYKIRGISENWYDIVKDDKVSLYIKNLGENQWISKRPNKKLLLLTEFKVKKNGEGIWRVRDISDIIHNQYNYIGKILIRKEPDNNLGLVTSDNGRIDYIIDKELDEDNNTIYVLKEVVDQKTLKKLNVLKADTGEALPSIAAGLLAFLQIKKFI